MVWWLIHGTSTRMASVRVPFEAANELVLILAKSPICMIFS